MWSSSKHYRKCSGPTVSLCKPSLGSQTHAPPATDWGLSMAVKMMTLKNHLHPLSTPTSYSSVVITHGSRVWHYWEEQACAAPWEEQTMDDMIWSYGRQRQGKDHATLFKCMPACRWRGKHTTTTSAAANPACMCGWHAIIGRPSCMHRIHHTISVRPVSSLDASVSECTTARQSGFYKWWLHQLCMQKWSTGFRLSDPCWHVSVVTH